MQTLGANRSGNVFTYVFMCILVSASGSVFNPVMSFFLSNELKFDSVEISIFFILLPIATITIVQTVAKFSDMGLQRPTIICISALFGIASAALMYHRPSFLVMCTLGLICLGSYPVSFPQIFASAREYAVKHMTRSLMFTTFLRSLTSLSWVVGPPLAYSVAIGYSFNALFILSGIMFALCCIISFFFLPNVLEHKKADDSANVKWWKNPSVLLLFVAFGGQCTAFSSYIISMPLFITKELHLPDSTPGFIMGLAAGIEIPLMFIAARLTKFIGLKPVVIIGAAALIAYLFIISHLENEMYIYFAQILPALYIAFVTTMGMVYFQELLPSIPGQSTSLFINSLTAGQVAGGALISLSASGSFHLVFMMGGIIASVCTLLIFFVKKPPKIS